MPGFMGFAAGQFFVIFFRVARGNAHFGTLAACGVSSIQPCTAASCRGGHLCRWCSRTRERCSLSILPAQHFSDHGWFDQSGRTGSFPRSQSHAINAAMEIVRFHEYDQGRSAEPREDAVHFVDLGSRTLGRKHGVAGRCSGTRCLAFIGRASSKKKKKKRGMHGPSFV